MVSSVPITITGCWSGSSHFIIWVIRSWAIAMHPAVLSPLLTCKKMPPPRRVSAGEEVRRMPLGPTVTSPAGKLKSITATLLYCFPSNGAINFSELLCLPFLLSVSSLYDEQTFLQSGLLRLQNLRFCFQNRLKIVFLAFKLIINFNMIRHAWITSS